MSKHKTTGVTRCACGTPIKPSSKQCQTCYRASWQIGKCDCKSHDVWTCQSIRHQTTPVNAWLTHGLCACPCHKDAEGSLRSREDWEHRHEHGRKSA